MFVKFKQTFIISFILVMLCVFPSFAITGYSDMEFGTFEDGPFMDQRAAFGVPDISAGGLTSIYAVPDWREGSSLGDAYYKLSFSSKYLDGYFFSKQNVLNNVCVASEEPLVELYIVDKDGVQIANVLDDAFLINYDGMYFYGVSIQNGIGVAFRAGGTIYFTEFSQAFNGGNYHDAVANSMPYMSGVYDGNSAGIRYPGIDYHSTITPKMATYGYDYFYFPVVGVPGSGAGQVTTWKFHSNTGVLNTESKYTFSFQIHNITNGRIFIDDPNVYKTASISGSTYTASIDGQDTSLSNLGFGFRRSSAASPLGICFIYKSCNSDDVGTIPPDSGDDGSGSVDYSSALGGIDKNISKLTSNLSNGFNEMNRQLSNQTSQMVSAVNSQAVNIQTSLSSLGSSINSKLQNVQNNLGQALAGVQSSVATMSSDISSKLSAVQTGITNKLGNVQTGITDKLGTVQTGITDKLGTVQSGITTKLTNVQNGINTKLQSVQDGLVTQLETVQEGLTDKLQSVQEGINTKLGNVQTAINNKLTNVQNGINTKLQNVTDHITGGYDNSSLQSDKSELDDALSQYEEVENELFDDAKEHINDFEFDTPLDSFTGPLADVSYFLSGMFSALGPMNAIISFSLTLTIAMVMIGWYRFKGGR